MMLCREVVKIKFFNLVILIPVNCNNTIGRIRVRTFEII